MDLVLHAFSLHSTKQSPFITCWSFCNLFYILARSFALNMIIGGSLLPSATIVSKTEILHFSWFWVLMITCLLPLFTIVLVKGIFKKTGVSSMFAMILELIPFFDLISLTSFKNRDACLKQSSYKICPKCVFVRKVNPFLERNLYIYLTLALILFSFLLVFI